MSGSLSASRLSYMRFAPSLDLLGFIGGRNVSQAALIFGVAEQNCL